MLNEKTPLRIMKFGGTSLADASCIKNVVEIIVAASQEGSLVVVVSAMAGVTNELIHAATLSERGEWDATEKTLEKLQHQHETALDSLINSVEERYRLRRKIQELFQEGIRLCQGTMLLGELTARVRDGVSSLGERLSAPLIAACLAARGIACEAIEATELIVTDSYHGAADPRMDPTSERCEARLRPLFKKGIVPVVTGFIGATEEGTLTTLGRGGSDYSATILGAVLDAEDVVIWTDVDGLQTADPRIVPGAPTIPEVSYREAAELAYFGAKVLHPKTLRALMECGIPVWIRNSFTPERPGTKITQIGPSDGAGTRGLAAIADAALITLAGPCLAEAPEVLVRTLNATAAVRADVLLVSQSSAQNEVCLVVSASQAKRTVEALHHEFAQELAHQKTDHINLDPHVSIVTAVGQNIGRLPGTFGRLFAALSRENINVIAIAQGAARHKISFVVEKKNLRATVATAHREFQLDTLNLQAAAVDNSAKRPTGFQLDSAISMAQAD
ncbi:MAG TPA: aspartate kinase [Terriglobales bacterium]|nr:aspartate kinase [Terriglobales bacterium]